MGEMADDHYDQIMDSQWGFSRRRHEPRDPVCNRCGKFMRWHEFPQGWRLANPDNSIHMCGTVADIDEFPEVP